MFTPTTKTKNGPGVVGSAGVSGREGNIDRHDTRQKSHQKLKNCVEDFSTRILKLIFI